jgi:hypothetical protein
MALLLGIALFPAATAVHADEVWTVSLDTSQLAANYVGSFGLDFELVGSNGNTVTVSDFAFGGGNAGPGSAYLSGGASGDLGTNLGTVTLNDSASFLSDFNQQFTPGTTLTFTVDSTLIAPTAGEFADNFSMVIFSQYVGYDPLNPPAMPDDTTIATTDPTGNDTFFNFNINGPGTTTVSSYPSASGDITITIAQASVPEPSSSVIMALGLIGMAGALCRRRK